MHKIVYECSSKCWSRIGSWNKEYLHIVVAYSTNPCYEGAIKFIKSQAKKTPTVSSL